MACARSAVQWYATGLPIPAAAAQALKVDVVVVVGDERLYSQLSNELRQQKGEGSS